MKHLQYLLPDGLSNSLLDIFTFSSDVLDQEGREGVSVGEEPGPKPESSSERLHHLT